MGRKAVYTTDDLKSFVDEYVRSMTVFKEIKINDLVDFCNKILRCNPPVTRYMFSRNNEELVFYIDKLNKKAESLRVHGNKESEITILPDQPIDIDVALSADKTKLKAILLNANRQIFQLSEMRNNTSIKLNQLQSEMLVAEEEINKKTEELAQNKHAMREMKKQIVELKKSNLAMKRFMKLHISEPIVLSHFKELGVLDTPDEITLPENTDSLILKADGSVMDAIRRYEQDIQYDVISKDAEKLINDIENL